MDLSRILSRLDYMVETKDFEGAKELLSYWLADAKSQGNLRGELSLYNESMGLYRKLGEKDIAVNCAENALSLVKKLEMEGSITAATTYINSATVYKAFGLAEKGIPLFEQAKDIYEKELKEDDGRLGGLYNNMGLALLDVGRYEDALESYRKALETMKKVPNGALESAITYLNKADVYDAMRSDEEHENDYSPEEWEERIADLVNKAAACFEEESLPRNGYYAFVAEKCIPSFEYYGHFMTGVTLKERVSAIIEAERESGTRL